MRHARDRAERTVQRARQALAAMAKDGESVTIAALAAKAGVSRSWLYTQPELRDQVERLQHDGAHRRDPSGRRADSRASTDSLRRRLELAHARIQQLRTENEQLRRSLAQALGHRRAGQPSPPATG
ncbi:MAG: DUF6262 family protein [Mycobacterium leprae]